MVRIHALHLIWKAFSMFSRSLSDARYPFKNISSLQCSLHSQKSIGKLTSDFWVMFKIAMFEGVFCIKLQNSGRTFKNTFRLCECLNGIGFVIPPSTTLTPLNFLENPNVVTMGIAQLAATALPKSSLEWNTSTQRSLSNLRDFPISLM